MPTSRERLEEYLVNDGYLIDLTDCTKTIERSLVVHKVLYSLARFATSHLLNAKILPGTFTSAKEMNEFQKVWEPARDIAGAVFHKFKHGFVYTAVLADAGNLSFEAIRELASIADDCALKSRKFALHQNFIQSGWIIVELFVLFSNSKDFKAFCKSDLDKCKESHRFKKTHVNAMAIDTSAQELVAASRPFGLGGLEQKIRKAIF